VAVLQERSVGPLGAFLIFVLFVAGVMSFGYWSDYGEVGEKPAMITAIETVKKSPTRGFYRVTLQMGDLTVDYSYPYLETDLSSWKVGDTKIVRYKVTRRHKHLRVLEIKEPVSR
jgi:hypothetical protein